MAREKIFAVGFDFPGGGVAEFDLGSDQSLLDADIILFMPGLGVNFSNMYYEYGGVNESELVSVEARIAHWRKELVAACEAGCTVFVFLTKPEGLNSVSSYSAIPLSLPKAIPTTGSGTRPAGDLRYLDGYWAEFSKHSHYEVYFEGDIRESEITIKTRAGNRTVGAAIRSGRGTLILVPPIQFDSDTFTEWNDEGEELWSTEAVKFGRRLIASLVEVHRATQSEAGTTPAPEWSSRSAYRLDREDYLLAEIRAKSSKIEILQAEKRELRVELREVRALRRLLYEQGGQLEEAVLDALKLFGFTADSYQDENSQFDAVFNSAEGRFLGEIEGTDRRPINASKLNQLERNLQDDREREGIEEYAKGVLFGNPHRLQPPYKRPSGRFDDFAENCIRGAARYGIALVRTADMFEPARYLSENDDSEYAQACREAIHQCEGQVVEFPEPPNA